MIGKLDQKITIERRVKTPDGGGGHSHQWVALASDPRPWAKVELKGGGEVEKGGARVSVERAIFTIRARSDLRTTDRIIWDGRVWNISARARPVARSRYQSVEATSGDLSR